MALSAREKAEAARYKPAKKKAVKKAKKKVDTRSAREKAASSFIPKKTTTSKKIGTGKLYFSTRKIPKSITKGSGLDELTPTEFKKIFGKSKQEYVKEINTTYNNEGLRDGTLVAAMQGMRRKIKSYKKDEAKPKRKTAVSKSVKPKARDLSISKTTITVAPAKKRQVERKRNVLSDFARLDKYISDLDKKIKANSKKLPSATKNKISMQMKKLRRRGKDGFEKSGMFTKAQMDAAKKRIEEMLKEK